jgi:tRNA modification GTPase
VTADTIYALSSGAPPAAIAVVRISGPAADEALRRLAGRLPEPRRASLAALRDPESGDLIDRALVLRFPGPGSATGEDTAELHLHGGRSVVAAVRGALSRIGGLREAEPGEFTRRAFDSGRIDLAEAEGLADLLAAETDSQRRSALALAGGGLSRLVDGWRQRLLGLAARLEATLDFSDEGEVGDALTAGWTDDVRALAQEIAAFLRRPPAERLRDGLRVVIAGPPNSGKSSLLNHLAGREAAITSAVAGTTRDVVEAPTAIAGTPFVLTDTAGLRESGDEVEAIGIERARSTLAAADIVLWLGDPAECPDPGRSIIVQSKADLSGFAADPRAKVAVSAVTGIGIDVLVEQLIARARDLVPAEGEVTANARHRAALADALLALSQAAGEHDFLIAAELLRAGRVAMDRVTGRAGVEDMLDALFGRFCIGK